MSVVKLNKDNFKEEVMQADKPVLIDFFATWCGPCKMLAPIVAEIAEKYPEFKICQINVDEEPELAQSFNISSIPTLASIKDGKIKEITVGLKNEHEILQMLK